MRSWELIEGQPVMGPSPVDDHQMMVASIATALVLHRRQTGASWLPTKLGDAFAVPALDLSIPLTGMYLWTSVARSEQ